MRGASTSRWVWLSATLVAVFGVLGQPFVVFAQAAYEITSLGSDSLRGVDRYRLMIGPGGSFWEVGTNHLPLVALEQGDLKAVELIEQAWRAQYPDRATGELRPGDSFILEVTAGSFVARGFSRAADRLVYSSFAGDELTTFPRDPAVQYRLRLATAADRAEVLINGGPANVVEAAKRVYDIDPPDFLQVRTVRAALQERTTKLTIDLTRKYLDEFRNFRERAIRVEDLSDRIKAYTFERDDREIPFVRIEDGIGDETDPGNFPRVFRNAYYRDGTVRRYIITQSGDSLGALSRPDNAAWTKIHPSWQEWLPGQPEALSPFTPAISGAGALLPGRVLVVAFRPRPVQSVSKATRTSGGSGADCLGVPLGLLLTGAAFLRLNRPDAL